MNYNDYNPARLTHSPALTACRGIDEYPPLFAPFGQGSFSPKGEAVLIVPPYSGLALRFKRIIPQYLCSNRGR